MSDPRVSICIPSYNHARFLPAAIESALAQTYPHLEIVIVDDGSTDGSLEIAEGYAVRYPSRVSVFTHPDHRNLGISATVNEGFRRSTGVYWSGLASDDVFMPEKIEQQVAFLESHQEIGWIYGPARYIDEHGNAMPGTLGGDITLEPNPIEKLVVVNSVPGMTVLVRRECFEQVGPHSENLIYSDWEFWIRMAAQFRVAFSEKPLVEYRIHNYNTSVGIDDKVNLKRGLEVMDSLRRNASVYGDQLKAPRIKALIELQRTRYLFCLGETEEAAGSLSEFFKIYLAVQNAPQLFAGWLTSPHPYPENVTAFYKWLIAQLRSGLAISFKKKLARQIEGLMFAQAAMDGYLAGDLNKTRRMAVRAQIKDPRWLCDRPLVSALTESLVGSLVMKTARQVKQRLLTENKGHLRV